jgi:hypothetical protein
MKVATISTFLALSLSVAAMQNTMATMLGAVGQCDSGDIACCDSKETISGDGILGNLLAKGALNGLIGNDNAACAKTDVLGDVNVLGMTPDALFRFFRGLFTNLIQLPPTTLSPALSARTLLPAAPTAPPR